MADEKKSREVNEFRTELDGTIYTNEDEIDIYVELRKDGMAEIGAIEALNSFRLSELTAITRFRRMYNHYFGDANKPSDLSVTVTADVGEALTGFKALQRELRETTKAVRELEQAYDDVEKAFNKNASRTR